MKSMLIALAMISPLGGCTLNAAEQNPSSTDPILVQYELSQRTPEGRMSLAKGAVLERTPIVFSEHLSHPVAKPDDGFGAGYTGHTTLKIAPIQFTESGIAKISAELMHEAVGTSEQSHFETDIHQGEEAVIARGAGSVEYILSVLKLP